MQSPSTPSKLSYFIAEKNSILIVTFVGTLGRDSAAAFEQCQNDVTKSGAKWVIVNCRDFGTGMEKVMVSNFARFEKAIREMPAVLRLTSLNPELRKFLADQGLLRAEEVTNNLAETLKNLPPAP